MSHHYIQADSLSYTYPGGQQALEGITFRISHGESVAIVGANGAGKSTLLMHLNGSLLSEESMLNIGDVPVTSKTLKVVRKTVGMVFQNSDDQLFLPTVFEDAAFGPLNMGISIAKVEEIVNAALHKVGISHLAGRPPYTLSGGEKRLAAIAGTLAVSPDILVLDEPSANLDPLARRNLINLLKTFEHTKVIASHDLDLVMDLCPRTIVLHQGKIKADGPSREIFTDDDLLAACGLERPLAMQNCPVCGKKK